MSEHTYAGHTLAEIKAAAEAAVADNGLSILHVVTFNPATVLAMAARIEELERDAARYRFLKWKTYADEFGHRFRWCINSVECEKDQSFDAAIDEAIKNDKGFQP